MIRFENIRGGYAGRQVLQGVSLTVPKGKITALVGPNGCGKTTLLRMACGLNTPSEGRVLIEGRSLEQYKRRELARLLAILPQTRETPALTVERLAAYGRYPHMSLGSRLSSRDRERVEEALREAGVWELRERELRSLSGGERQRAYIAMALAQDSQALLLDEPTTYLDIGQKKEVMELARRLNARGKTILAVLHDLSLAFSCSDYVAVMAEGELKAFGTPEEVSARTAEIFGVKETRIRLEDRDSVLFY